MQDKSLPRQAVVPINGSSSADARSLLFLVLKGGVLQGILLPTPGSIRMLKTVMYCRFSTSDGCDLCTLQMT